jgi:DNA (cytosine-5)-methyltransferase 1
METVAFCEQNTFCQKILRQHWPTLPIHSDITELNGYEYRGTVELVCGGFPCQPFSVAGKQLGAEDDRALWPEMLRVIREVAPRWVIGENVSGIIPMELDNVLSDLEGEGYTCWTFVLPACSVDAHHRRDRVWVLAHTSSRSGWDTQGAIRGKDDKAQWAQDTNSFAGSSQNVADTASQRQQRSGESINSISPEAEGKGQATGAFDGSQRCLWLPEPNVGRVANGVPNRSHRLKALGNAVVPPLVAEIGRLVTQFDREKYG